MSEQGQEPSEQDVPPGDVGVGGGGRATRGPAVRPGGEQEPGGLTPPYEGRKEGAEASDQGPPEADVNVGGATTPVRAGEGLTSEEPEATPRGSKASPADEQPAAEMSGQQPDEEGVGPAHTPGTGRGEDKG